MRPALPDRVPHLKKVLRSSFKFLNVGFLLYHVN